MAKVELSRIHHCDGRPPSDRRLILNGLLYFVRSGCAWRLLPREFGPWETVYGCFRTWRRQGLWKFIHEVLRRVVSREIGKRSQLTGRALPSESQRRCLDALPAAKVVAQALKDYGLIVADNGSAFYLTGASYSVGATNQIVLTWNDNDIQDTAHGLKSLLFTNFEVVDVSPAVTNVSPAQAVAGASVAVSGRNYSGAAGRLRVWFGSNQVPATVTDDAHATAIAPSGSGTVDVRVQSGLSNANSSANYTSPIWGYGLSVTSSVARFAYQSLDPFHSWLASYGLPSDGSADSLHSDGDGLNNWQEYLAGTNPTNASSVFKIIGEQVLPGGQFVLRWLSASNRLYDVMRGTNLTADAGAFAPVPGATNLAATPPQNTWTDSVSPASTRAFYRLTAHQ